MLSPASAQKLCQIFMVAIICMAGFFWPINSKAEDGTVETGDLIRSAMVYNFCKFVQWPGEDRDTLILGVLSHPGSNTDFSSINGKMVQAAKIEIRQVTSVDEIGSCHLVFIDEFQSPLLDEAFAVGQNESVLTISEMEDFCTQGGIIQLVHRRGKLRFFINREAARESQLVLSSQLLKMAKIVGGN